MQAAVSAPLAACVPLSPRRCSLPATAAPQRAAGQRPCRLRRLAVASSQRLSEADIYQGVSTEAGSSAAQPAASQQPTASGPPLHVVVPAALVGLIAALRVAKTVKKKVSGGSRLAERGFKKDGVADEGAYTRAMKGMRIVQYEELSEEQILAARKRRQREVSRDAAPLDIEQIELPENHPFAVRRPLAPEEENLQRNRLSARRGLSAEDMQRLREQQALADQMEAEEEARQATRRRQGSQ